MGSLKGKLIIMYLAMVFIVMTVSGTFMLTFSRSQSINQARDELKAYANLIDEQIIQVYSVNDFQEGFNRFSPDDNLSDNLSLRQGGILTARGQVLYAPRSMGDIKSSVIISALAGSEDFKTGRKYADPVTGQIQEWMEFAQPVWNENNEIQYVIYVRADAGPIRSSMGEMARSLLLTMIIALALAAVIGYLFSTTLTGPIAMLTKIARAMAMGNLNQEIIVKSDDEIGQLTVSFNDMAKALSLTMASVTSEKNKMEIILHNMTDGVLAYDASGRLIHANYICQELLNDTEIESLSFADMMAVFGAESEDLSLMEPGTAKEHTFSVDDRYISAIFTTYSNTYGHIEGIVIVLRDITQLKKLDNMRKEFVANVSHELRTPLTTIKSYAETLLDGALEDRETAEDFLSVIDSETDRMTVLVRDLLELSRYDNRQMTIEKQWVNIIELIHQNIRQHQVLADSKHQSIAFQPKQSEILLYIDPQRINQVLTNILSNAVKYSEENGSIQISAADFEGECVVSVKDDGMGIPKKDLEHIFERFYRVDKARSRAMGGTGLGLAIAKEIMEAHGGSISAESQLEKGTLMILHFPKEEGPAGEPEGVF